MPQNFATKHTDLVKTILEEQRKVEEWAISNRKDVAKLLAEQTRYKPEVWAFSLSKRPYFGVLEINHEYVAEQQQVADLFYKQKLIPKPVQVKEAIWKP